MAFSYAEQQRMIAAYLKAEIKNVEKATEIVMKQTAAKLTRETKKQLRRNFKKNPKSNFAKAVKAYKLPPKGALGPAAYVRLGVPWIEVFEKGATIQGTPWLSILLPDGEALGFPRKMKNPMLAQAKAEGKTFSRSVRDGWIVYLKPATKGDKPIPIYKVQKSPVKVPKKLDFYATAESLGDEMPQAIADLMN
jgi:hypothetical protein